MPKHVPFYNARTLKRINKIGDLADFIIECDSLWPEQKKRLITKLRALVPIVESINLKGERSSGKDYLYKTIYDLGLRDKFWNWNSAKTAKEKGKEQCIKL